MSTEMLTKPERRSPPPASPVAPAAPRGDARRVRRLKLHAAAWAAGTILVTTIWVVSQWRANGALESFGHEGEPGQWNPTLWAVVVGAWGLVVGIMALGVRFTGRAAAFHVSAWLLGMAVLTPLWALIEWQDNGGFERFSNASRPGEWDPWILVVGAIWALSIVAVLLSQRRRDRES